MAELAQSQTSSKAASKSDQTSLETVDTFLSGDPDWKRLRSNTSENRDITYSSGYSQDGMATIKITSSENEWRVIYGLVTEGGSEPVSNITENPDYHNLDLPYNRFEDKQDAVEYAETLMQINLQNLFEEYGLKPDTDR